MNDKLAAVVRQRHEGTWSLLAAAAGDSIAVDRVSQMISKDTLGAQVHPDYLITERVEALAAYNPDALARLAREWPKAGETFAADLAWVAGLRHLIPIMKLQSEDFAIPRFGLAEEASILWLSDVTTPITWLQAFQEIDNEPVFNYRLARRLGKRPLVGPMPSVSDLERAPVGMLLLLRGHMHRCSHLVHEYLVRCALRCLSADLWKGNESINESKLDPISGQWIVTKSVKYIPLGQRNLEGDADSALPIVELCREFDLRAIASLGGRLVSLIPRITEPKLVAPLVYLLLTSWTLP
jgi:hypothetical protein